MNEDPKLSGWALIGAAIVLLIALTLTAATVGWSQVAAAWVQAIGSVLALALTGGLAVWENHQRRVQAGRRDANKLRARAALMEKAIQVLVKFADANERKEVNPALSQRAVTYMAEAILEIRFDEMPTGEAVNALAAFRAAMVQMNEWIEDNPDTWMSDGRLLNLKRRIVRMTAAVSAIRDDAARLES